ncbi:MAG: radical SAM protein [Bryobacterales bacterium]|nr:radical SAM protein [Bryobacteraceae bacterium]MDW8354827.1 radical SAM protein [Bryobacterales bacterium]
MKHRDVLPAWGRVLRGYRPLLSVEITKECPLHCPGCYAYEPMHLGANSRPLRELSDYRGDDLVHGMLALVRRFRPIHLSIVGGEPLVRWRELDVLLPKLDAMGIEVQLVTSAVRPVPAHWAALKCLHLVVSVDGLPPEHDRRRAPATYDRILKHIAGHQVIVHCTVTRQQLARPTYLHEFAQLWSQRPEARKIWFSLYTPQEGECSAERLRPEDRKEALRQLAELAPLFPKVQLSRRMLDGLAHPPRFPEECLFARVTHCVTADLKTEIHPCQFGGRPVCSECGCIASAGLAALARYRIAGLIPVMAIFDASRRLGEQLRQRLDGHQNGGLQTL